MNYYKAGILGPEAAGLKMPPGYGVKKIGVPAPHLWVGAGLVGMVLFEFDPVLTVGTIAVATLIQFNPLVMAVIGGGLAVYSLLLATAPAKALTGAAAKAAAEKAAAAVATA